ncbi:MAG: N-formylglutamate deformylase [Alphaproteobacteria bacterium]|nr:N-formylglutamate deformylase [Alphaproteobacteria bacterium]
MEVVRLHRGDAPLIISMPHVGTHLPADISDTMTPLARHVPDTDWHVDRLYAFARERGATMIASTHSRYVIDLNRAPDNKPLYPGADNTELCPLTTFDHEPIYLPGQGPDQAEIARRIAQFWQPYHDTMAAEIARLRAEHDAILVWDGHSIRSQVSRFFDGQLPDFNLGTGGGIAADAALAKAVVATAQTADPYTTAYNGRFKGGYITRTFGKPEDGVHAIQLELSQVTYMEEELPFRYLPEPAAQVSSAIARMVETGLEMLKS